MLFNPSLYAIRYRRFASANDDWSGSDNEGVDLSDAEYNFAFK